MTKRSASISSPTTILGLDVGDRRTHYCALQGDEVVDSGSFKTVQAELEAVAKRVAGDRVILEAGSQSPWMSRCLRDLGMTVHVADPRQLQLISKDRRKTDRRDAEMLARLERGVPEVLGNVHHRSEQAQCDLAFLRCRDQLVASRVALVLTIRGQCKAFGVKLPRADTKAFAKRMAAEVPQALMPAIEVLLDQIKSLSQAIATLEKRLSEVIEIRYPEVTVLRQVNGVGLITAATFALTIEDPTRFQDSRQIGSWLGLAPRSRASGDSNPQLPISKCGDGELRRLLVQCGQYILGPFGQDSDLRRFGLRLAERGGRAAKKKAVVAVARKLAVLLHRLWSRELDYDPLHSSERRTALVAS